MRALGAIVLCAAIAAGCGGRSEPEVERLRGGQAEGPGFTFPLSKEWRALTSTEQAEREVSDAVAAEVPGLDLEAGLLFAGLWIAPDQEEQRPAVNVAVEPVTADTSLERLATSSLALIEQTAERPERRSATLGGDPAVRYAYDDEDDKGNPVEKRGIVAKRGDFAYTVSVQMIGSEAAKEVDELVDQIAAGWRWRELDPAGRKRLSGLSEFEGEGYHVTLPPGWRGTGREALANSGQAGLDAVWRGVVGARFSTNVNVGRLDPPAPDLAGTLREVVRDERRSDAAAPGFELESIREVQAPAIDGEPAGALELTSTADGNPIRALEVVAIHDSELYRVTLSSLRERYPAERRAFLRSLASWRWR